MTASGIHYTIFFYTPDIHPQEENLPRQDENIRPADDHGMPFVAADHDTANRFKRAKGMECAPERDERCTMCLDMGFERTALYAHENGFPAIPRRSASRPGRTCESDRLGRARGADGGGTDI